MRRIKNLFCDHPIAIGETYLQHLHFAFEVGFRMITAGCCCIIHSIFPFLFTTTASRTIAFLQEKLQTRKATKKEQEDRDAV